MFVSFRRRITGGYVLLALTLIVMVVAASSALAFILYAHQVSDAVSGASQRATEVAAQYAAANRTLAQAAPAIARTAGRGRLRVAVFDAQHRLLAENRRPESRTPANELLQALGNVVGLPRARVPVAGGTVAVSADFDRFGQTLLWYWSIMVPVGILAMFIAWFVGRRITARAVGPLADVTRSLQGIAAGNLESGQLLSSAGEMHELTTAYNDVVLRVATAMAERRQAESQIRQFIADAGHELRTPLTVIMGYLDLLRAGALRADESSAERAYEMMSEESRRMRGLIERLILLARLERTAAQERKAPVDLRAVVDRARQAVVRPGEEERIRIHDDAPAAAVTFGEQTELYEAVKNVLDNAAKYAPGGPVDVSVQNVNGSVEIAISDSGPGMDPQDVAHAFDRFYRGDTKHDVEGSGLGLAIAKRAVERAGGSIFLESTPEKGTRVTLKFPLFSEDSQK
jgi:two-component system, OmpR family, sensor kinase